MFFDWGPLRHWNSTHFRVGQTKFGWLVVATCVDSDPVDLFRPYVPPNQWLWFWVLSLYIVFLFGFSPFEKGAQELAAD
jgi:hypothetical protein